MHRRRRETRNGGGLASVAMQVSKRWRGDGKFELRVVERAAVWTQEVGSTLVWIF